MTGQCEANTESKERKARESLQQCGGPSTFFLYRQWRWTVSFSSMYSDAVQTGVAIVTMITENPEYNDTKVDTEVLDLIGYRECLDMGLRLGVI